MKRKLKLITRFYYVTSNFKSDCFLVSTFLYTPRHKIFMNKNFSATNNTKNMNFGKEIDKNFFYS